MTQANPYIDNIQASSREYLTDIVRVGTEASYDLVVAFSDILQQEGTRLAAIVKRNADNMISVALGAVEAAAAGNTEKAEDLRATLVNTMNTYKLVAENIVFQEAAGVWQSVITTLLNTASNMVAPVIEFAFDQLKGWQPGVYELISDAVDAITGKNLDESLDDIKDMLIGLIGVQTDDFKEPEVEPKDPETGTDDDNTGEGGDDDNTGEGGDDDNTGEGDDEVSE